MSAEATSFFFFFLNKQNPKYSLPIPCTEDRFILTCSGWGGGWRPLPNHTEDHPGPSPWQPRPFAPSPSDVFHHYSAFSPLLCGILLYEGSGLAT